MSERTYRRMFRLLTRTEHVPRSRKRLQGTATRSRRKRRPEYSAMFERLTRPPKGYTPPKPRNKPGPKPKKRRKSYSEYVYTKPKGRPRVPPEKRKPAISVEEKRLRHQISFYKIKYQRSGDAHAGKMLRYYQEELLRKGYPYFRK